MSSQSSQGPSSATPGDADDARGVDAETDETAEPTPGSDNDGAEGGYTPPSASDDPVSD